MTYSLPLRRTTEQPSQNLFTELRTFIPLCCCSNDLATVDACATAGNVRRAKLVEDVLSVVDVVLALRRAGEQVEDEEQSRACAGTVAAVRLVRMRRVVCNIV